MAGHPPFTLDHYAINVIRTTCVKCHYCNINSVHERFLLFMPLFYQENILNLPSRLSTQKRPATITTRSLVTRLLPGETKLTRAP